MVGVSRVGLYDGTKHTTATHLLAQDVSERTLMALTRHREAKSVRRATPPLALVVPLDSIAKKPSR